MNFYEFVNSRLAQRQAQGRFRRIRDLHMISSTCGYDRQGRRYLLFNTNDYLGLSHHPRVQAAARRAVTDGCGAGGSRLLAGAPFILRELEEELADFKGTEAALLFSTGYMANVGVLSALPQAGDVIFSDALNHASIIDGCRMSRARTVVYAHMDMDDLEKKLQHESGGRRYIVTDGVFSMDGHVCPLPALVRLKQTYGAVLLVDDAHGLGVLGKSGRGTAEHFACRDVDIHIGTLSKSLGALGGYVAASEAICRYLQNESRPFIFSTALPPAVAAAALTALRLLRAQGASYVAQIRDHIAYMCRQVPTISQRQPPVPVLPILTGSSAAAMQYAAACAEAGLLVSAVRPPTVPEGTARLRITVTAGHTPDELRRGADILNEQGEKATWKQ